ncbi:hypothetical protein [Streptomyces gobiensis]|uniref:hypothetical protein n=1 Tax=Streptomyces gobiensis TaxID=2875706 RepID=UPI001E403D59|nr:hypothetical protein [Streptomyces gobiensis]UGY91678.1 hypothetical protein test1122_08035 [Streptomyces gobiensis]
MAISVSRRRVLAQAIGVAGAGALAGVGVGTVFSPSAAAADGKDLKPDPDRLRKAQEYIEERKKSGNGWAIEDAADDGGAVRTRAVPGTGLEAALQFGDPAAILIHVISRFHYEVDGLEAGDVVGWRKPSQVNVKLAESNQASGTAVAIRPGSYPPGTSGGFFPLELVVIRDILAECDGVVRWGGDDKRAPNEALFFIDVPPDDDRLTRLADKIRGWGADAGSGAGVPVDVLAPQRRDAAKRMERLQQAA